MGFDRLSFVIRVLIACVFLVAAWSGDEERNKYAPGLKFMATVGSIGFIIGGGIGSTCQLLPCWLYLTPTLADVYNSGISDPIIFIKFTQNLVILCYLLWFSLKAFFARNESLKTKDGFQSFLAEEKGAATAAEGSPPMAATVKV